MSSPTGTTGADFSDELLGPIGRNPAIIRKWSAATGGDQLGDVGRGRKDGIGAPGAKEIGPHDHRDRRPVPGQRHLLAALDCVEQLVQL
ncbi:MAG: hypothetical protein M5U19_07620 [Microthrixaceae bacterium]|nr:hypothetical protein [Microthrixaceae bacterium]